jgi:hypothetical protein
MFSVQAPFFPVIGFAALPFANQLELEIHFDKHGRKFGLLPGQEVEYERMADEFMFLDMPPSVKECRRPNGLDRLRFCFQRTWFGVAYLIPECVKTFYPPDAEVMAEHGGKAAFFRFECGRMMV